MRHQQKLERSELWLFVMPVLTLVLLQGGISFRAWNVQHPFWATITDPILDKLNPARKHNGCVNGLKQIGLGIVQYTQDDAPLYIPDDDASKAHHQGRTKTK